MAGISRKVLGVALATVAVVALGAWGAYFLFPRAEISGGDAPERVAAIHRITVKRALGAGKALAEAAANDESPRVRREAMAALSHFLKPEHRPVVEKGTRDQDVRVRAIAADTLGLFRDKAAADVLVKLAQSHSEDEEVRRAALRGLARCDDPRAVVVLLETAAKDRSTAIKMVAMKGLIRRFGGKLAQKRKPRDEALWRDLIQRWKWDKRIREAYAAAGARLVDRPQDIMGRDWHPERHKGYKLGHRHDGH